MSFIPSETEHLESRVGGAVLPEQALTSRANCMSVDTNGSDKRKVNKHVSIQVRTHLQQSAVD